MGEYVSPISRRRDVEGALKSGLHSAIAQNLEEESPNYGNLSGSNVKPYVETL